MGNLLSCMRTQKAKLPSDMYIPTARTDDDTISASIAERSSHLNVAAEKEVIDRMSRLKGEASKLRQFLHDLFDGYTYLTSGGRTILIFLSFRKLDSLVFGTIKAGRLARNEDPHTYLQPATVQENQQNLKSPNRFSMIQNRLRRISVFDGFREDHSKTAINREDEVTSNEIQQLVHDVLSLHEIFNVLEKDYEDANNGKLSICGKIAAYRAMIETATKDCPKDEHISHDNILISVITKAKESVLSLAKESELLLKTTLYDKDVSSSEERDGSEKSFNHHSKHFQHLYAE